jgi:hypothetical protein
MADLPGVRCSQVRQLARLSPFGCGPYARLFSRRGLVQAEAALPGVEVSSGGRRSTASLASWGCLPAQPPRSSQRNGEGVQSQAYARAD